MVCGKRRVTAKRLESLASTRRPGEKQEEILPKQILVWTGEKLKRSSLSFFLASMFSLFAGIGHATAIKVMCDSPVEPALTKVADLFRQETNNQVTLACNAGPAIKKRIKDDEVADVVVVEPDFAAGKSETTTHRRFRLTCQPTIFAGRHLALD